jgi:putative transcriptional regulator
MKKQDLREALGLGPYTIAKMGKGENISLEVLDKLCSHFGVQPNDIIEHVEESSQG